MKPELYCTGDVNQDRLSYKFKPFTPQEFEQNLPLYIFQGINPSPQLMMETKSQSMEPVQGNDLIAAKLRKTLFIVIINFVDILHVSIPTNQFLQQQHIQIGKLILS